jgi:hypothetical protein
MDAVEEAWRTDVDGSRRPSRQLCHADETNGKPSARDWRDTRAEEPRPLAVSGCGELETDLLVRLLRHHLTGGIERPSIERGFTSGEGAGAGRV